MTTCINNVRHNPMTLTQHFMDFTVVYYEIMQDRVYLNVEYQNINYHGIFLFRRYENEIPVEELHNLLRLYGGILWRHNNYDELLLTRMLQINPRNNFSLEIRLGTMYDLDFENQFMPLVHAPRIYYETTLLFEIV